jgi:predicted transcriptional regulator
MRTTLTIRADKTLRAALERRARAEGKTLSAVAREILRDALEKRPLEVNTGQLKLGRVETEDWRKVLRERNWRS